MTSYQNGPFDTPQPFAAAPNPHNSSPPSPYQGVAEEGYFGPQGSVPTGPAPPNSYAPAAQHYPTRAQKEYAARRDEAEPTSPMSIPQPRQQQPYNAQDQAYAASPRRQSLQYGNSPAYPPSSQPYGTSPSGRRLSQPYAPGMYTPQSQDRRQSLPRQPYQQAPPVDQLHPTEAYQIPQQSGQHVNGRRVSQVSLSPRQSRSSSERDDFYEQRPPLEGSRRYSDAHARPRRDDRQRRASSHDPRPRDYDEDSYYQQRRRGSRGYDNRDSADDRKDRDERRHSKGSSTGGGSGGSGGRSKKEVEKAKKEAYGRPSYGESLSWAGRNMKKFFSSDRD